MVERLRNETNLYEDQNIETVGLKVKNQMLEQSVTFMKQLVVGLLTICIVLSSYVLMQPMINEYVLNNFFFCFIE
ncbi:hypothetical protein CsSME_00042364 [Camellia sinensis var. sinensis]